MSYWVLGSCLGNLLGYGTDFFYLFRIESFWFFLLILFIWLKFKEKLFIIILGFIWGATNNVPWAKYEEDFKETSKKISNFNSVQIIKIRNSYRLIEAKEYLCFLFHIRIQKSSLLFHDSRVISECKIQYTSRKGQNIYVSNSSILRWFNALYLGRTDKLLSETKHKFAHLGISHLLAISGLHITFLSNIALFLLDGLVHLLYSLLMIRSQLVYNLKIITRIICIAFLFWYVCLIGGKHPGQRALIMFIVGSADPYFFANKMHFKQKILIGVFLQTLFYPTGFAHGINLLSWFTYITVIVFCFDMHRVKSYFFANLILLMLSLSIIGEGSLVGLIANFFFIPIFYCFFIIIGVGVLWPLWRDFAECAVFIFEQLVDILSLLISQNDHFIIRINDSYISWRILILLGAVIFIFKKIYDQPNNVINN